MIPKIYPYKLGSKSAKDLAQALNCLRVKPNGRYRPKPNHLIINWGSSTEPSWAPMMPLEQDYEIQTNGATFLNSWEYVEVASNKLTTFQTLINRDVPTPDWTQNTGLAQAWIDDGHTVYGRKTLTGHSGQGIIIFESETITSDQECPLYTKSTKAKHEFRIHVGDNGESIIDQVQKKRKTGFEGGRQGIRSHADGWVFVRQGISVPDCVLEAAKGAVKALSLDFGAVDVGYNLREDKAYVYEVNTAPAMEGQTLTSYVEYFQRKLECTPTLSI